MNLRQILLLSILLCINSYNQGKKELFYNYNLDEISKELFISLKNKENHTLSYENETSIKTYLIQTKTSGTLNYYILEDIKKYLLRINPKTALENSNYIVINYIDHDASSYKKGFQVPWDVLKKDISKPLNKQDNVSLFYIANPDVENLYYYHGDKRNFFSDEDHFIRKNFSNSKTSMAVF